MGFHQSVELSGTRDYIYDSQMVLVGCMTSTVSYCIRHLSNKTYVRLPNGIRSIAFREFYLLTRLRIKWWKDIVDGQHTGYSQPDQVVSKESTRADSVNRSTMSTHKRDARSEISHRRPNPNAQLFGSGASPYVSEAPCVNLSGTKRSESLRLESRAIALKPWVSWCQQR